ncbi:uncharacterized protein LOC100907708 [Galendromus occidentalis]|uniref:Pulmonary surfactant-associated protein B n=1 Tax=Galendromus occidentalis TaxID=34638 RepID=A0AAJ7SFP6_9ACAR|nr:uncharacterized protein LOC100907708 [Galendromus occidentalis]
MRALWSIVAIAALAAATPDPRCNSLRTSCSDLFLAIDCGTVNECIPRWETLETPVGNDTELCATCKKMVQEARENLLSNMTQIELREVLEGSCDDLIPIPPFNVICKKLMDAFQDELNDMLVSRMDPTQVCTVSGLCWKPDNSDIEQRASDIFLRKSAQNTCTTCKTSVSDMVGITKFVDKTGVIEAFSNICQNSGYAKQRCDGFAQTYVAKFLHHFHTASSEKTCQFFGRCDGMRRPLPKGPTDTLECEFCEAMIHKVVVQFNNTSAKEQVKTVLENICKKTGSYAEECQQRIEDDFDKAYDELISMLDPVNVCTLAGICNSNQSLRTIPMMKLTPARPAAPGSTTMCTVCRNVAGVVQTAVNANFTQKELISALDLVCDVLSGASKENCFDFVNTNIPQLIQMFNERFTVDHICSESFNFCPAALENSFSDYLIIGQFSDEPSQNCSVCLTAMSWVFHFANGRRHRVVIKFGLDEVCNKYPNILVQCKRFKDMYSARILDLVEKENVTTAPEVCTRLKLCPETLKLLAFTELRAQFDEDKCQICETAISWVASQLNATSTENDIIRRVQEVCDTDLFPPKIRNSCRSEVESYGSLIIHLLVNRMDPEQICPEIRLCKTARATKPVAQGSDPVCDQCQHIAGYVVASLNDDRTEENIKKVLDKTCEMVPVDYGSCKQLINDNIDRLVQILRQEVTADEICEALKMCKARRIPPPRTQHVSKSCGLCSTIVDYLIEKLKGNTTDAAIIDALEKVCKVLPMEEKKCQNFIDVYGSLVVSLIEQELAADAICAAIGLCGAPKQVVEAPKTICDECEQIAGYLVNAVNDNRTEENIKAVLEKTCEACPAIAKCQEFIDKNVDKLFELLRQAVTVDEICQSLGLCATRIVPVAALTKHEVNSESCGLCNTVVSYLIDALKDNATDAAAIDALERVCKVLPYDQAKCRNVVDVYGGYIIALIQQDVAADEICSALGLCGSPKRVMSAPGTICEECEQIAGYIVNALNDDHTEENIKSVLEKTCAACPAIEKCQEIIDNNVDKLFELLREEVTVDKICQTIGLCESRKLTVAAPKTTCDECEQIAGYIVNALNNNRTEENIKAVLEKTCAACPAIEKCQEVIDEHVDELFELLKKEVTVDKICRAIGLCGSRKSAVKAPKPTCAECEQIAGYIVEALNDNRTEENIKAVLEKTCAACPAIEKCQEVIDENVDKLFELLREEVTVEKICQTIGLCGSRKLASTPVRSPERVQGQTCELCRTVTHFLIDELKDNKTDEAVLEVLERVCKVLPVDRVECDNAIDTYGQIIISMIRQNVSADQICSAIGLCSSRMIAKKVGNDQCNVCVLVTGFLIDELNDNKTDAAVIAALEKACSIVPVDKIQCKNYVDVYGSMVIEMIKNNLSADEICSSLGFCFTRKPPVYENQVCPLCEIAVNVVEEELRNNNTQKQIEVALEKACSLMPKRDQESCRNMVNVYTAYIIDMVESLATAEQICQTLGLCPTPPTPPKCEVCLYITNFVESELGDNRTEARVQELLGKVCNVIPNMDVAQCKATVEQASDMIITLLLQMVPPRKICEEIKLCPASSKRDLSPKVSVSTSEQCTFCKWLVTWVDDKLQDKRTEAVIIKELDAACDLLSDAGKCKDMVNDYVDMIVKMLVIYAEPEKICEAIKKCPAKQLTKDEPPCRYCRYVIDELRNDFQKTEAELKDKLDGICRVIPVDATACQSFVDRYADQIISLILSDTDPERICEVLGVCPKKIKASSTKCNFCREVMHFITNEIKDEATDDEIVAMMAKACNLCPAAHRDDCQRMIEIEGLVIVRMIAENIDPESICEAVKYCPGRGDTHKLTCTWCQYALHFLQEKLYDNSTQQAIREELQKMCSHLPTPEMNAECREFVDIYGASLEVIIAQDLDPSVICPAIHACPARRAIEKPVRRTRSQKCHDCVSTLRSFRHSPTQICTEVAPQFAAKCPDASSIGLRVVDAFESDFRICQYAKSCSKLSGRFSCNRGGCQLVR